jgi:hypothetical protein
MAKQAYVYSGTDWVPLASEVTNLSGYQTKALNQFAHRNLIINGDMQVAQRGTSTASITSGDFIYRTADRFNTALSSLGTWTESVENDAPTGSGFRKSLKVLCTAADASPAAADYFILTQFIEGQNLQHIKKGTAAAEQLTVSFWVKSNRTGTYILELRDIDNTRSVSKSYTVSASGTWEYKTITFPADTTGAFDNDNGASLRVSFYLAVGSNFTSGTLQTSWGSSTDANLGVGQTNLAAATSNYWQVTGVQLEVGATATPFEFKTFEDNLFECQRYYEKSYNHETALGSALAVGWLGTISSNVSSAEAAGPTFKVVKRANPTIVLYNAVSGASGAIYRVSDAASVSATTNWIGTGAVGNISFTGSQNGYYYHYTANAEL